MDVVINARHLAGPKTGIEVYMEHLMGALGRTGRVRITAVSWEPLDLQFPGVREVVPVRRPEFRAGSLPATLWKLWFDQWRCLRPLANSGPILYHGMDGFLPFSLRSRDRAVVTVHDLGWQAHPELYNRRLRLMYGGLFPWVVRRADQFIAVSRYTADDLMRRANVPASRIEVVYHGLDPVFSGSGGSAGTTNDEPYVLAVGGVSPRKNTRRLIAAFSRWRARGSHRSRYRLLITGTSLDTDFAQNGSGMPDGVSLLGYVDKAELPGLYAGATTFLYPGIYEGFGLPIIEAMACGTPVVTSETGAAPEIAGGAAILVNPFEIESIEAGLERSTIPGQAQRLRELGRERARAFRWERAADATIEVYKKLSL
jgi:glycosyltransferase involved in cell wall biosynthesis